MTNLVSFNNAEVTFSTMLNKIENKNFYGRVFTIKVPIDSPQIKELQAQFKTLNENAKKSFSEQVGKKVKDASKEKDAGRDLFEESQYYEGFAELKFQITNIREKEVKQEDGTTKKSRYETLNPIYPSLDICYKIDNNGKKEYKSENGKNWYPLNTNIVNVKCSLVASYLQKDNRVKIQLKANEVELVKSDVGSQDKGPRTGFLTLDNNEEFAKQVESAIPVEDNEMFNVDELASLDV